MLWSFLAGALPVLAFPRAGLGWLAWVGLVPGLLLIRAAADPARAWRRGWAFGFGYLLAAVSWMTPSIGPGVLVVALVFSAPWALWGLAVRACRGAAALVVVPSVWVLGEYARSWHGFGGPWAVFGVTQWRHPAVLALAGVGGVWALSFVLVLVNVALVEADRRALAVAFAAVVAGPALYLLQGAPPVTGRFTVALVQPGIMPDPASRFDAGERITRTLPPVDLVVWGESSVGYDLRTRPDLRERVPGTALVNEDARDAGGRISKSSVLLEDGAEQGRYVKTRLVPFGEYVPFRFALGWLTRISKAAGEDRVPGTGAAVMDVHGTAIAPIVCFESAFPDLGRAAVGMGARVIVVQSATSSFQDSWAPPQHAALGAVRAAESGRPVVQAALTGVSAAFDARGRRLAWMDTGDRGAVVVPLDLPVRGHRTLYSRLGDLVPLLCLLVIAGLGVGTITEKSMRAS
ncbi:apolipoprotein N-acyltransferase [Actinocorallia longicatena]|uniref:Apolipoprotein N-acyltransferase n=1 Tax=Actinocorallia longicatena TaxID=111803 RepID=A0ABP6QMW9_9ACTN